MLKKYRNRLVDLVREANLDPRKFRPTEKQVQIGAQGFDGYYLTMDTSTLYFVIATRFGAKSWEFRYIARECEFNSEGPKGKAGTWSNYWTPDFGVVEKAFRTWLDSECGKYFSYRAEEEQEMNTPDFWAELDLPSNSAADFQALQNTPFSSAEQARIADTLNEFLKETQSQQLLSTDELRKLHEQVDYLITASKRLGRKDWVMAATGALFSFTLQAGLTAGTASQLFHLASEGLKWIVVHLPLLNP